MKVMPHRQYKDMMDGIRRITLCNRKFFKKIFPVVGDSTYKLKVHPETTPSQQLTPAPQPTPAPRPSKMQDPGI